MNLIKYIVIFAALLQPTVQHSLRGYPDPHLRYYDRDSYNKQVREAELQEYKDLLVAQHPIDSYSEFHELVTYQPIDKMHISSDWFDTSNTGKLRDFFNKLTDLKHLKDVEEAMADFWRNLEEAVTPILVEWERLDRATQRKFTLKQASGLKEEIYNNRVISQGKIVEIAETYLLTGLIDKPQQVIGIPAKIPPTTNYKAPDIAYEDEYKVYQILMTHPERRPGTKTELATFFRKLKRFHGFATDEEAINHLWSVKNEFITANVLMWKGNLRKDRSAVDREYDLQHAAGNILIIAQEYGKSIDIDSWEIFSKFKKLILSTECVPTETLLAIEVKKGLKSTDEAIEELWKRNMQQIQALTNWSEVYVAPDHRIRMARDVPIKLAQIAKAFLNPSQSSNQEVDESSSLDTDPAMTDYQAVLKYNARSMNKLDHDYLKHIAYLANLPTENRAADYLWRSKKEDITTAFNRVASGRVHSGEFKMQEKVKQLDRIALEFINQGKELTGLIEGGNLKLNQDQFKNYKALGLLARENQLEYLDLRGNKIIDLSPLSNLVSLKWLLLDDTKVLDLQPLAGLLNLESLSLANTPVWDLRPLSGMTKLDHLDIHNTPVKHLFPISKLWGLRALDLRATRVEHVGRLVNLNELRYLQLEGSSVTDCNPLQGMQSMRSCQKSMSR